MATYRNKIGVNVHSAYNAYKNQIATCKAKLDNIGIKWLRDNNPSGPAIWGPSYNVVVVIDTADAGVARSRVDTAIAGGAKAIELVNEPPIGSEALSVDKATNLAIIDQVAGRVPVWSSALASPNLTTAQTMGQPAGVIEGAIHPYRGNMNQSQWDSRLASFYSTLTYMANGLPYNITETGWHDYYGTDNAGHNPTPDSVAAVQIISDTEREWNDGCSIVFFYELYDEVNYRSKDDHEGHFGLYFADWSIKPQGTALKNYLATNGDLTWSSGGSITPPPGDTGQDPGSGSLFVGGVETRAVSDAKIRVGGVDKLIYQMIVQQAGKQYVVWTRGDGPPPVAPDALTLVDNGTYWAISGSPVTDNGDGTATLTSTPSVVDNGDGTATITA